MNTNQINLNNPAIARRIKKYDTYVHQNNRSARRMDVVSPNQVFQVSKSKTTNYTKLDNSVLKNKKTQQIIQQQSLSQKPKPKPIQKISHNSTSQINQQVVANPRNIAVHSVANSKEITNNNGLLQRQFSDDNKIHYAESQRKTSKLQKFFYALGVLVFLFSTLASVNTIMTNNFAKEKASTLGAQTDSEGVDQGTGSNPSETPVSLDAVTAYQVRNPEDPRYIRIPELNVFARMKNLGVDSNGAVDAPWNIHDAGWYNGSVRPGNGRGTSLILGHVSSWTSDGVFKNVDKLKPGSKIEIEKGSGEIINYEVTKLVEIALNDINMAQVLSPDNPNVHDIKLMTCSGKYNDETETFENRLIVHAKRI